MVVAILTRRACAIAWWGASYARVSFKWVKNNIAAFGGNPELLTIFGQSAGAMSVAVHMVMESSQGLFQHAIMESEPFGLPFRTPKTWVPAVSALAKVCRGELVPPHAVA